MRISAAPTIVPNSCRLTILTSLLIVVLEVFMIAHRLWTIWSKLALLLHFRQGKSLVDGRMNGWARYWWLAEGDWPSPVAGQPSEQGGSPIMDCVAHVGDLVVLKAVRRWIQR